MNLKKGKLVRGFFATLSLLLAFCMLTTGCGLGSVNNSELPDVNIGGDGADDEGVNVNGGKVNNMNSYVSTGLESGFDFSVGGAPEQLGPFCAFKSEKNEFDIDNVT